MEIHSARMLAQSLLSGLSKTADTEPADGAQAARFRALLQPGAPADAQAVSGTDALSNTTAAVEPGDSVASGRLAGLDHLAAGASPAPTSLGDSILRGLAQVRDGLNAGLAQANDLIDPQSGPMSTSRLLQFQVGMLNMGFQYQMVASVVTKTAQNIDQLVKMQ